MMLSLRLSSTLWDRGCLSIRLACWGLGKNLTKSVGVKLWSYFPCSHRLIPPKWSVLGERDLRVGNAVIWLPELWSARDVLHWINVVCFAFKVSRCLCFDFIVLLLYFFNRIVKYSEIDLFIIQILSSQAWDVPKRFFSRFFGRRFILLLLGRW